jgi:hypothetical protein
MSSEDSDGLNQKFYDVVKLFLNLLCQLIFNKCIFTASFCSDLNVWGRYSEQKLTLSLSFRLDQIHDFQRYVLGQHILCYLSRP